MNEKFRRAGTMNGKYKQHSFLIKTHVMNQKDHTFTTMAVDIEDNLMVLYELSIFSGKLTDKLLFVPLSNLVENKRNKKISIDCIKTDEAANKMHDRKFWLNNLNCNDIVFFNCDVIFPTYELRVIEAYPIMYHFWKMIEW